MLDVKVNVDRSLLRLGKLPGDMRQSLKTETQSLSVELQKKSKDKASSLFRVITGKIVKSIRRTVRATDTSVTGRVYSKHPIFRILERGAKPHDIRPKKAKTLLFFGVHREGVRHPGFRGRTLINAAFQEMKPAIRDRLEAAVKGVAKSSESQT